MIAGPSKGPDRNRLKSKSQVHKRSRGERKPVPALSAQEILHWASRS